MFVGKAQHKSFATAVVSENPDSRGIPLANSVGRGNLAQFDGIGRLLPRGGEGGCGSLVDARVWLAAEVTATVQ